MDGIFQPTHIILILVAALLIFGPKRLPDIGKSIGRGIREFKGGLTNPDTDDDLAAPAPAQATATSPEPVVPPAPAAPSDPGVE